MQEDTGRSRICQCSHRSLDHAYGFSNCCICECPFFSIKPIINNPTGDYL